LAPGNITASLDSANKLVFTTANDFASSTIGAITLGATPGTLTFGAIAAPVADPASQTIRANLVSQYNNIITQITTTSQDSSFNGINLLNGDDLKLTFNETGKSTLNIKGVTYNAAGLGLALLTSGTDFLDNNSANATLTKISNASTTLRTEASTLGSNLSVVQIRQDFNKNLINVLQTGSANLTLADTNEEAANSQALSTRQSIAVSALALANQSQQSVLKLLQ
jgi:flagellin-like hook-associated protein FlgL